MFLVHNTHSVSMEKNIAGSGRGGMDKPSLVSAPWEILDLAIYSFSASCTLVSLWDTTLSAVNTWVAINLISVVYSM